MSDTSPRSSPLVVWTLIILGIAVLYFLGYPWVAIFADHHDADHSTAFKMFAAPWKWLVRYTPLDILLSPYLHWCLQITGNLVY